MDRYAVQSRARGRCRRQCGDRDHHGIRRLGFALYHRHVGSDRRAGAVHKIVGVRKAGRRKSVRRFRTDCPRRTCGRANWRGNREGVITARTC